MMTEPDPDPSHPEPDTLLDVVAIDGPSGAGKSSVAKALAERLGFRYLDTGAMYRAVTWFALLQRVPIEDEDLAPRLPGMLLQLPVDGRVLVGQTDVTHAVRSKEVESKVSAIAALPSVRKQMRLLQRQFASLGPVVAEGRDMGSVVFPKARWKFYLDASAAERARRRQQDFAARGRQVSQQDVQQEMAHRDLLDSSRTDAPLCRAGDAELVDTTGLSLEQVVELLHDKVRPSCG